MSNEVYDRIAKAMLGGQFDWTNTDMFLVAWTGPQNFVAADEKLSQITARGSVILGMSMPINSKAVTDTGMAQSDTIVIPNIPIGPPVTFFTMHEVYDVFDDSPPVFYVDDSLDLPYLPNGLDMYVQPDWLRSRGWFRP